jgi:hypothetical protein
VASDGKSTYRAVRLDPSRIVVPPECACCGALASRAVLESRFASRTKVLVPYCANCHEHASRARTRALGGVIASALLAVTFTAGLPLAWQPPSSAVYAIVAAGAAALPLALLRLRRERPDAGHASAGRAAFFGAEGALVCASSEWAARLAAASNAPIGEARMREPVAPPWAVALPIVCGVAALLLYGLHFPIVRVLNVTATRLAVAVDGRTYLEIEPTSAESAAAGASVRIPAGRHVLTATDPRGRVVDTAPVNVEGGVQHLYAPGSLGVCFWIEATSYGRRGKAAPAPEALPTTTTFWTLSRDIDVWFAPSPPRPEGDDRSSGGLSYAVRQARCDDVPGHVLRK